MTQTVLLWVGFHVLVLAALILDLGAFNRKAHVVGFREALIRTGVWVALAILFACGIWWISGHERAMNFVTGYIIEESLSADNIFVFVMIFSYFAVPRALQHRVLLWGILGAIILRGIMILAGAALLHRFEWIAYIFGAFLVVTGLKMVLKGDEQFSPNKNPVIRLATRWFPMTKTYEGDAFFTRNGRRIAITPLFVVLLVVEMTDVVFAVDSIPAVFAVTTDTFIVYTSNLFAILGLRSLFFVLSEAVDRFRYLTPALAAVLIFVGLKMCLAKWVHVPVMVSLGVVLGILAIGVLASWLRPQRD